jgi:hypothetical protein
MNWSQLISQVLAQIGTVTAIVAILAVVGKLAVEKFFQSGVEVLKAELKRQNDLELAEVRQSFQKELLAEKAKVELERDRFQQSLHAEAESQDRIRAQLELWANPILNAVRSVHSSIRTPTSAFMLMMNIRPALEPIFFRSGLY